MTPNPGQNDGGEPGGGSWAATSAWLRELLAWPASGSYLPGDEIERWVALSREGPPSDEDYPDLDQVLGLATRPRHWRWLGIALLVFPRVSASLGPAVRKLGRQGLRRILATKGRPPTGVDAAIAFIDGRLIAGVSPADIDFSKHATKFQAWEGDGIRFALSVLGRVNRPPATAKSQPALVRSQASGGSTRGSLSGAVPASFLGGRSKLPDLPLADLRDAPSVVEVPSSGDDESGWTGKDFGGSLIYENWIAEHCADLHLSGALIPGTDRAFLRIEAQALGERLEQVMASSKGDALLYLAALAYSISMVTSEPRQSVIGAMAHLAMGRSDSARAAWLEPGRFRVRVPGSEDFGKVAKQVEAPYLPCLQDFWLPLPALLAKRLATLGKFDSKIWHYSREGWDIHFDRLKSYLKPSTARFSEVRLRNVLPVAIWMRTADIIKAQILTGQLLDHPSAALHYYAFELGELTATYRESVAPWVSSAWRFAEEDSTLEGAGALIGAPRAAIADSAVKAAIKNLADRCHHTLAERENDLHSLILAYNEFVTYAASIFAEATANRLTYHLGLLGRRDFILPDRSERPVGAYADGNALVVFTDKHSDHGLSFRAAAIPPVAVQQILALLDFVAYLAARLLDFSGGREASRGLQRILAGDRALFQKFKRVDSVPGELGYRLVRYKRRDFAELWPEIPVPAEHLRHRFTTVARRCGMSPSDIRIQMGHSMDFVPFGATDPDSPLKFVSRVAPLLEVGLKREGWQSIGVSTFDKAPELEPLSAGAVQRLDALLSKRIDHRWVRYRQVIAREQPQFRAEIESEVAALAADSATAADAALSASDVSRIEKRLKKQHAETGRWPAVSQAFRIWLRQEIASGSVRAEVPRVAFYRNHQVPVITPATPRAYHSACALLRVAEKLDTSIAKSEGRSVAGAITENQLAFAAVELSVRAGLTQSDRLLAGIRALGSADSYDDRADRVVLRLVNQKSDAQADSRGLPDSKEGYAEGFLLTGNAALLALSWRAGLGHLTSSLAADSVRRAVSTLFMAERTAKASELRLTLESVLATAALARRLTVSGVRSAFEEGRFSSRTFDPARERLLRDGTWRAPTSLVAAGAESAPNAIGGLGKAGHDEEFVLEMRKNLHQWLRRKKKLSHDEVATRFESKLAASPECGGTSAVFVRLVVRWLRGEELAWRRRSSTVYTYLTLLVTQTFAALDGRDLLQLDAEEIEEIVQRTFFGKRVGNHHRMRMVLDHFLQVIAELGGARPEEDPLAEWASLEQGHQAKPYCLSVTERDHAMAQLDHWRDVSASGLGTAIDRAYRSSDISMARYLLACAEMGLRVGESESRQKTDLLRTPGGLVMLVRPHRRSPLKTLASPRSLVLEEHLSEKGIDTILSAIDAIKEPASKLPSSDASSVASAALRVIAHEDSARLQACRHAVACSGFAAIFDKRSVYRGFKESRWLNAFANHPPAIQLLALARTLGHATPITTLSHYVHLIGYGADESVGWPEPDSRGCAAHALLSYGAFRTRLSRANKGGDLKAIDDVIVGFNLRPNAIPNMQSDVFKPSELPAGKLRRQSTHEQLGKLLLDIAKGATTASLLAEHGVDESRRVDLQEEVLVLQENYRYHLFDPGLTYRSRAPRSNSLVSYLSRCDVSCIDEVEWRVFLTVLKRQTKLSSRLRIPGKQQIATVRKILESIFGLRTQQLEREGSVYLAMSAPFHQGSVSGQAHAPFVFVYFVCLLVERLHERFDRAQAP